MPEVRVKHNVADAKAPDREAMPSGTYDAIITQVKEGVTNFTPALQQMTLEFTVIKTDKASIVNDEPDDKYKGRSVFQDYILEPGPRIQNNAREAFRIQQLMAATKCPHKTLPGGQISFNTDNLMNKAVKITLYQRAEKPKQGDPPNKEYRKFNGIDRVDSSEKIDENELV